MNPVISHVTVKGRSPCKLANRHEDLLELLGYQAPQLANRIREQLGSRTAKGPGCDVVYRDSGPPTF